MRYRYFHQNQVCQISHYLRVGHQISFLQWIGCFPPLDPHVCGRGEYSSKVSAEFHR